MQLPADPGIYTAKTASNQRKLRQGLAAATVTARIVIIELE
jgi:hypothetical protein